MMATIVALVGDGGWMTRQAPIGDPLGIACGPEDFLLILAEHVQPAIDIGSVLVDVGAYTKFPLQEDAGKLGAEFLHRICLAAEAAA